MSKWILAAGLALGLAAPALAEDARYVIPAMGVSCGGSAARAEQAVSNGTGVQSVVADHREHTVTAVIDEDATTIAAVVRSLNDAGYDVGEPRRVE